MGFGHPPTLGLAASRCRARPLVEVAQAGPAAKARVGAPVRPADGPWSHEGTHLRRPRPSQGRPSTRPTDVVDQRHAGRPRPGRAPRTPGAPAVWYSPALRPRLGSSVRSRKPWPRTRPAIARATGELRADELYVAPWPVSPGRKRRGLPRPRLFRPGPTGRGATWS